jgi:hypothetical protein
MVSHHFFRRRLEDIMSELLNPEREPETAGRVAA